jgi:hypothetical protein
MDNYDCRSGNNNVGKGRKEIKERKAGGIETAKEYFWRMLESVL